MVIDLLGMRCEGGQTTAASTHDVAASRRERDLIIFVISQKGLEAL